MMEYPSKRQKVSRIQRRAYEFLHRNRLQNDHKDLQDDKLPAPTTLFPRSVVELREPLLVREKRGGPKRLDDKHRLLHHRATITKQDTVLETVIAQVDGNGSTVAVQTFPSVPTVPPFPSDLTVPAVPQVSSVSLPVVPSYPFGSSATTTGTFQATATGLQSLSFLPTTAVATLSTGNSTFTITSSTQATDVSVAAVGNNSTVTSTGSISSLSSIAPNTTLASLSTLSSPFSSSSRSATQSRGTASNAVSTAASTSNGGGGGAFGTAASPGASSSPTSAASSGSGGNSGPGPSTSTVVGGVFGGLAGVALILALALLLLRWYKQKHRSTAMERIEEDPFADPPIERSVSGPSAPLAGGSAAAAVAASRPSMSQRRSFLPAAAVGFINRFSSGSKESDYSSGLGSPTQERGFQKISGRKLPSAFSEGITEADVASRRSMLSDGSFYRNSHGFSSVTGMDAAGPSIAAQEKETLMPSPARTPVVHQPFTLSATPPPRPATQDSFVHPNLRPGTLGRSHPSQDGSRGSRFTEEVV